MNEVHQIYSPLAQHAFEALNESMHSNGIHETLFHDYLRGSAYLHDNRIMHRDINLGIVSYNPLRAMIMDFGAATTESISTNHFKGTIVLLAPEMMALEKPRRSRAAIWSRGGYLVSWCLWLCFLWPAASRSGGPGRGASRGPSTKEPSKDLLPLFEAP